MLRNSANLHTHRSHGLIIDPMTDRARAGGSSLPKGKISTLTRSELALNQPNSSHSELHSVCKRKRDQFIQGSKLLVIIIIFEPDVSDLGI